MHTVCTKHHRVGKQNIFETDSAIPPTLLSVYVNKYLNMKVKCRKIIVPSCGAVIPPFIHVDPLSNWVTTQTTHAR